MSIFIQENEPASAGEPSSRPVLYYDRQRTALRNLLQVFADRRKLELEEVPQSEEEESGLREEAQQQLAKMTAQRDKALADVNASHHRDREQHEARFAERAAEAQRGYDTLLRRLEGEAGETKEKIQTAHKDACWSADSVLEARLKHVQNEQAELEKKLAEASAQITQQEGIFAPLLQQAGLNADAVKSRRVTPVAGDDYSDLEIFLARIDTAIEVGRTLTVRRWLSWTYQAGLILLGLALAVAPAFFLVPQPLWLSVGAVVGAGLAVLQRRLLQSYLHRRMTDVGRYVHSLLTQARTLIDQVRHHAEEQAREQRTKHRHKHDTKRQKADAHFLPLLEQHEQRVAQQRRNLEKQFQDEKERRGDESATVAQKLEERHQGIRADCQAMHDQKMSQVRDQFAARIARLRKDRSQRVQAMQVRWEMVCSSFLAEADELSRAAAHCPPDGDAEATGAIPAGLPLGAFSLHPVALLDGLPASCLPPLPSHTVRFPAFLPFPGAGGLLLHCHSTGKAAAIPVLQQLMLRYLTALPPGKVRFTILDPVGLGDNFAAFMHLADHNEALVTSRIWTEPAQIETQLAALTEHMETVIQKYLRSQFDSIEEYNDVAGEVAEPYRVLVVSDFPVHFSPQAARRLVSIAESGASCGVHVLVSADTRQSLPQGFQLEDLSELCLNLRWDGSRFAWGEPGLDRLSLIVDSPPVNARVIELVRRAGERSRDASRVEVPFSFIAPPAEQVWQGDSRRGLRIPLGRAGAVRKLEMRLGVGTAQHVLVAGKTGSGKSTLWHALIANMALHYSPDELELYLIDFKKGVEFKTYATCALPHARVIAIESEREFGLSVLQWLDAELRKRGDLFRATGVNDLASYREARPSERMPRVLLIVDEFQEFFVEDDKLSQEAALLLDRLVRQGRAFGLHILLGSQTLGGVYSLARSTIDQMAVRIALQCSETDAQLILNKDNAAARLLSRPGEAIYNDASGAFEGNEIFQVVWLPEEERETIVRNLAARAKVRSSAIVFESNAPAQLDRNPFLDRPFDAQTPPRAWLGEAIAIKEPTAAVFRARAANNLLIVGQHEEAALGMLASSLIGLALHHGPDSARFWLLDAVAPDEPLSPYLSGLVEGWRHPVQRVARAELAATLAGLAEEVQRRVRGEGGRERGYVLIHGLQYFRELRRADDDFSFGRRNADRTKGPDEYFQAILRDGPSVGIHLLMWCDQLTTLNRVLDRQNLRECGLRVLFQMSATDSSQLIDTPAASKLGRHRALYFHDEMAQPEKFRPYDLPSLAWLRELKAAKPQTAARENEHAT